MAQATDEIRRIVNRHVANLRVLGVPVKRICLFGSQARRDADKDSDPDLAEVLEPL
jgi:predicted nucleotidyltransferase